MCITFIRTINDNFFLSFSLQFCKNFRVGERCCEFECLDPPGENNLYLVSINKGTYYEVINISFLVG